MNIGQNYQSSIAIRFDNNIFKTCFVKTELSKHKEQEAIKEFENEDDLIKYLKKILSLEETKVVIMKTGRNIEELKKIFSALKTLQIGPYGMTEIVASNLSADKLVEIDFKGRSLKRIKTKSKTKTKSKRKAKK